MVDFVVVFDFSLVLLTDAVFVVPTTVDAFFFVIVCFFSSNVIDDFFVVDTLFVLALSTVIVAFFKSIELIVTAELGFLTSAVVFGVGEEMGLEIAASLANFSSFV